ncbi:MAG: MmcQ/YjbR family DNA-binding protein [Caldimonas sp.]
MNLAQVRRIALALAGSTEEPHFDYASFRVGGKIFATAPPDGAHLHVFVDEEEREVALAVAPGCVEKLLWGGRVVGVRILLAEAERPLVERLLGQAWLRKSAKGGRKPARTRRP